jgi:hypothetical protein
MRLARLMSEGFRLALVEQVRLGILPPPAVPAAPVVIPLPAAAAAPAAAAPAPAGAVLPIAAAVAPLAAAAAVVPAMEWVLDEPLLNHEVGDVMVVPPGAPCLGDRALIQVGAEVAVCRLLPIGGQCGRVQCRSQGFFGRR